MSVVDVAGYFFDSSAIVKRYVQESGTGWVRRLTRHGRPDPIYLVRITAVEVTSAVARRRRSGSLTSSRVSTILTRFRHHVAGRYLVVEITPDSCWLPLLRLANLWGGGGGGGGGHVLRAYDAVQLAAAMELNRRWESAGLGDVTLVSADQELNAAATAEGLTVEDPNSHP